MLLSKREELLCGRPEAKSLLPTEKLSYGELSAPIGGNGPQAGVSFLLIKLTHFKVNTQKITLAWCYISVVAILFY